MINEMNGNAGCCEGKGKGKGALLISSGPQRFQESVILTSLVDMTFTMSKG